MMNQSAVNRQYGFLGHPNDINALKGTKLERIQTIVNLLPYYIARGNIRSDIKNATDKIYLEDFEDFTQVQKEAAFRNYVFLLQAYVRGKSGQEIDGILPENFSKQIIYFSELIGCEPIINYAATVTFNWQFINENAAIDNKDIEVGELIMGSLFTGSIDEAWFYMISAAADVFSPRIIDISHKLENDRDFSELREIIVSIKNVLKRMYEENSQEYFYQKIRRFMSGWLNDPKLPNGVVYTFPSGEKKKLFLSGASAAQSPTLQLLDIILDIQHNQIDGSDFLKEMRKYMPREHRQVLEYFEERYLGKRQEFTNIKGYRECVEEMKRFREVHFSLVHNYILKFGGAYGTGGSDPALLLNSLIKDTKV